MLELVDTCSVLVSFRDSSMFLDLLSLEVMERDSFCCHVRRRALTDTSEQLELRVSAPRAGGHRLRLKTIKRQNTHTARETSGRFGTIQD